MSRIPATVHATCQLITAAGHRAVRTIWSTQKGHRCTGVWEEDNVAPRDPVCWNTAVLLPLPSLEAASSLSLQSPTQSSAVLGGRRMANTLTLRRLWNLREV